MKFNASKRRYNYFNTVITIVIAFVFLFESTFGYAANPVISASGSKSVIKSLQSFYIPSYYGEVVKKGFSEESIPDVVLISDAHCNYEAQKNIAGILKILVNQFGIKFVGVEGAKSIVDLRKFAGLKDEKKKQRVLDKFVKEGYVTGPEFLKIVRDEDLPVDLFGVEDVDLYKNNFNSLKACIENWDNWEICVNKSLGAIKNLKEKVYNAKLKEFDIKAEDYNSGKLNFSEFIAVIGGDYKNIVENEKYNNIKIIIKCMDLEKTIDLKKADTERAGLIKKLTEQMAREDVQELTKKSLEYRLGKIGDREYYDYLAMYTDFEFCPNLKKYAELVGKYEAVDKDSLLKEVEIIIDEIYDYLSKTSSEKELVAVTRDVSILDKAIHLKLSNRDLQYYKTIFNKDVLKRVKELYLAQSNENLDMPSDIDLTNVDKFYDYAIKRNAPLLDNLLSSNYNARSVLITGGFHTEAIADLLSQKGISYAVIRPRITNCNGENAYFRLLKESIGNENIAIATLADKNNPLTQAVEELKTLANEVDSRLWAELQEKLNAGNIELVIKFIVTNWQKFPESVRGIFLKYLGKNLEKALKEHEDSGATTSSHRLRSDLKDTLEKALQEAGYEQGRINQILLYRGLSWTDGEIVFLDNEDRVFEIAAECLNRVLRKKADEQITAEEIKAVIEYHETVHLTLRKNKEIIRDVKETIDKIARRTQDQLFASFANQYGDYASDFKRVEELIASYYTEKMLVNDSLELLGENGNIITIDEIDPQISAIIEQYAGEQIARINLRKLQYADVLKSLNDKRTEKKRPKAATEVEAKVVVKVEEPEIVQTGPDQDILSWLIGSNWDLGAFFSEVKKQEGWENKTDYEMLEALKLVKTVRRKIRKRLTESGGNIPAVALSFGLDRKRFYELTIVLKVEIPQGEEVGPQVSAPADQTGESGRLTEDETADVESLDTELLDEGTGRKQIRMMLEKNKFTDGNFKPQSFKIEAKQLRTTKTCVLNILHFGVVDYSGTKYAAIISNRNIIPKKKYKIDFRFSDKENKWIGLVTEDETNKFITAFTSIRREKDNNLILDQIMGDRLVELAKEIGIEIPENYLTEYRERRKRTTAVEQDLRQEEPELGETGLADKEEASGRDAVVPTAQAGREGGEQIPMTVEQVEAYIGEEFRKGAIQTEHAATAISRLCKSFRVSRNDPIGKEVVRLFYTYRFYELLTQIRKSIDEKTLGAADKDEIKRIRREEINILRPSKTRESYQGLYVNLVKYYGTYRMVYGKNKDKIAEILGFNVEYEEILGREYKINLLDWIDGKEKELPEGFSARFEENGFYKLIDMRDRKIFIQTFDVRDKEWWISFSEEEGGNRYVFIWESKDESEKEGAVPLYKIQIVENGSVLGHKWDDKYLDRKPILYIRKEPEDGKPVEFVKSDEIDTDSGKAQIARMLIGNKFADRSFQPKPFKMKATRMLLGRRLNGSLMFGVAQYGEKPYNMKITTVKLMPGSLYDVNFYFSEKENKWIGIVTESGINRFITAFTSKPGETVDTFYLDQIRDERLLEIAKETGIEITEEAVTARVREVEEEAQETEGEADLGRAEDAVAEPAAVEEEEEETVAEQAPTAPVKPKFKQSEEISEAKGKKQVCVMFKEFKYRIREFDPKPFVIKASEHVSDTGIKSQILDFGYVRYYDHKPYHVRLSYRDLKEGAYYRIVFKYIKLGEEERKDQWIGIVYEIKQNGWTSKKPVTAFCAKRWDMARKLLFHRLEEYEIEEIEKEYSLEYEGIEPEEEIDLGKDVNDAYKDAWHRYQAEHQEAKIENETVKEILRYLLDTAKLTVTDISDLTGFFEKEIEAHIWTYFILAGDCVRDYAQMAGIYKKVIYDADMIGQIRWTERAREEGMDAGVYRKMIFIYAAYICGGSRNKIMELLKLKVNSFKIYLAPMHIAEMISNIKYASEMAEEIKLLSDGIRNMQTEDDIEKAVLNLKSRALAEIRKKLDTFCVNYPYLNIYKQETEKMTEGMADIPEVDVVGEIKLLKNLLALKSMGFTPRCMWKIILAYDQLIEEGSTWGQKQELKNQRNYWRKMLWKIIISGWIESHGVMWMDLSDNIGTNVINLKRSMYSYFIEEGEGDIENIGKAANDQFTLREIEQTFTNLGIYHETHMARALRKAKNGEDIESIEAHYMNKEFLADKYQKDKTFLSYSYVTETSNIRGKGYIQFYVEKRAGGKIDIRFVKGISGAFLPDEYARVRTVYDEENGWEIKVTKINPETKIDIPDGPEFHFIKVLGENRFELKGSAQEEEKQVLIEPVVDSATKIKNLFEERLRFIMNADEKKIDERFFGEEKEKFFEAEGVKNWEGIFIKYKLRRILKEFGGSALKAIKTVYPWVFDLATEEKQHLHEWEFKKVKEKWTDEEIKTAVRHIVLKHLKLPEERNAVMAGVSLQIFDSEGLGKSMLVKTFGRNTLFKLVNLCFPKMFPDEDSFEAHLLMLCFNRAIWVGMPVKYQKWIAQMAAIELGKTDGEISAPSLSKKLKIFRGRTIKSILYQYSENGKRKDAEALEVFKRDSLFNSEYPDFLKEFGREGETPIETARRVMKGFKIEPLVGEEKKEPEPEEPAEVSPADDLKARIMKKDKLDDLKGQELSLKEVWEIIAAYNAMIAERLSWAERMALSTERNYWREKIWKAFEARCRNTEEINWEEFANEIAADSSGLETACYDYLVEIYRGDIDAITEYLKINSLKLDIKGRLNYYDFAQKQELMQALKKLEEKEALNDEERSAIISELIAGGYQGDASFPGFKFVYEDIMDSFCGFRKGLQKYEIKIPKEVKDIFKRFSAVRVETVFDHNNYGWMFNISRLGRVVYLILDSEGKTVNMIDAAQQAVVDSIEPRINAFGRPVSVQQDADITELDTEYGSRVITAMARFNKFINKKLNLYPFRILAVEVPSKTEQTKGVLRFGRVEEDKNSYPIEINSVKLKPGAWYRIEFYFARKLGDWICFAYEVLEDGKTNKKPAVIFACAEKDGKRRLCMVEKESAKKCIVWKRTGSGKQKIAVIKKEEDDEAKIIKEISAKEEAAWGIARDTLVKIETAKESLEYGALLDLSQLVKDRRGSIEGILADIKEKAVYPYMHEWVEQVEQYIETLEQESDNLNEIKQFMDEIMIKEQEAKRYVDEVSLAVSKFGDTKNKEVLSRLIDYVNARHSKIKQIVEETGKMEIPASLVEYVDKIEEYKVGIETELNVLYAILEPEEEAAGKPEEEKSEEIVSRKRRRMKIRIDTFGEDKIGIGQSDDFGIAEEDDVLETDNGNIYKGDTVFLEGCGEGIVISFSEVANRIVIEFPNAGTRVFAISKVRDKIEKVKEAEPEDSDIQVVSNISAGDIWSANLSGRVLLWSVREIDLLGDNVVFYRKENNIVKVKAVPIRELSKVLIYKWSSAKERQAKRNKQEERKSAVILRDDSEEAVYTALKYILIEKGKSINDIPEEELMDMVKERIPAAHKTAIREQIGLIKDIEEEKLREEEEQKRDIGEAGGEILIYDHAIFIDEILAENGKGIVTHINKENDVIIIYFPNLKQKTKQKMFKLTEIKDIVRKIEKEDLSEDVKSEIENAVVYWKSAMASSEWDSWLELKSKEAEEINIKILGEIGKIGEPKSLKTLVRLIGFIEENKSKIERILDEVKQKPNVDLFIKKIGEYINDITELLAAFNSLKDRYKDENEEERREIPEPKEGMIVDGVALPVDEIKQGAYNEYLIECLEDPYSKEAKEAEKALLLLNGKKKFVREFLEEINAERADHERTRTLLIAIEILDDADIEIIGLLDEYMGKCKNKYLKAYAETIYNKLRERLRAEETSATAMDIDEVSESRERLKQIEECINNNGPLPSPHEAKVNTSGNLYILKLKKIKLHIMLSELYYGKTLWISYEKMGDDLAVVLWESKEIWQKFMETKDMEGMIGRYYIVRDKNILTESQPVPLCVNDVLSSNKIRPKELEGAALLISDEINKMLADLSGDEKEELKAKYIEKFTPFVERYYERILEGKDIKFTRGFWDGEKGELHQIIITRYLFEKRLGFHADEDAHKFDGRFSGKQNTEFFEKEGVRNWDELFSKYKLDDMLKQTCKRYGAIEAIERAYLWMFNYNTPEKKHIHYHNLPEVRAYLEHGEGDADKDEIIRKAGRHIILKHFRIKEERSVILRDVDIDTLFIRGLSKKLFKKRFKNSLIRYLTFCFPEIFPEEGSFEECLLYLCYENADWQNMPDQYKKWIVQMAAIELGKKEDELLTSYFFKRLQIFRGKMISQVLADYGVKRSKDAGALKDFKLKVLDNAENIDFLTKFAKEGEKPIETVLRVIKEAGVEVEFNVEQFEKKEGVFAGPKEEKPKPLPAKSEINLEEVVNRIKTGEKLDDLTAKADSLQLIDIWQIIQAYNNADSGLKWARKMQLWAERNTWREKIWQAVKEKSKGKMPQWRVVGKEIGVHAKIIERLCFDYLVERSEGDLNKAEDYIYSAFSNMDVRLRVKYEFMKYTKDRHEWYLMKALKKIKEGKALDENERNEIVKEFIDGDYQNDPTFPKISYIAEVMPWYANYSFVVLMDIGTRPKKKFIKLQSDGRIFFRAGRAVNVESEFNNSYGWLFRVYDERRSVYFIYDKNDNEMKAIDPLQQSVIDAISQRKDISDNIITVGIITGNQLDTEYGKKFICEIARNNKFSDKDIKVYPFVIQAEKGFTRKTRMDALDFGELSIVNSRLEAGKYYKVEFWFSEGLGKWVCFVSEILGAGEVAGMPVMAFTGIEKEGRTTLHQVQGKEMNIALRETGRGEEERREERREEPIREEPIREEPRGEAVTKSVKPRIGEQYLSKEILTETFESLTERIRKGDRLDNLKSKRYSPKDMWKIVLAYNAVLDERGTSWAKRMQLWSERNYWRERIWDMFKDRNKARKKMEWREFADELDVNFKEFQKSCYDFLLEKYKGDLEAIGRDAADNFKKEGSAPNIEGRIRYNDLVLKWYLVRALAKIERGDELDEFERYEIVYEFIKGNHQKDKIFPAFQYVEKTKTASYPYSCYVRLFYTERGGEKYDLRMGDGVKAAFGEDAKVNVESVFDDNYGWLFRLKKAKADKKGKKLYFIMAVDKKGMDLIDPIQQSVVSAVKPELDINGKPIRAQISDLKELDAKHARRFIREMMNNNKFSDRAMPVLPFKIMATANYERGKPKGGMLNFGEVDTQDYVVQLKSLKLEAGKEYSVEFLFSDKLGRWVCVVDEVLEKGEISEEPVIMFTGKEKAGVTRLYQLDEAEYVICAEELSEDLTLKTITDDLKKGFNIEGHAMDIIGKLCEAYGVDKRSRLREKIARMLFTYRFFALLKQIRKNIDRKTKDISDEREIRRIRKDELSVLSAAQMQEDHRALYARLNVYYGTYEGVFIRNKAEIAKILGFEIDYNRDVSRMKNSTNILKWLKREIKEIPNGFEFHVGKSGAYTILRRDEIWLDLQGLEEGDYWLSFSESEDGEIKYALVWENEEASYNEDAEPIQKYKLTEGKEILAQKLDGKPTDRKPELLIAKTVSEVIRKFVLDDGDIPSGYSTKVLGGGLSDKFVRVPLCSFINFTLLLSTYLSELLDKTVWITFERAENGNKFAIVWENEEASKTKPYGYLRKYYIVKDGIPLNIQGEDSTRTGRTAIIYTWKDTQKVIIEGEEIRAKEVEEGEKVEYLASRLFHPDPNIANNVRAAIIEWVRTENAVKVLLNMMNSEDSSREGIARNAVIIDILESFREVWGCVPEYLARFSDYPDPFLRERARSLSNKLSGMKNMTDQELEDLIIKHPDIKWDARNDGYIISGIVRDYAGRNIPLESNRLSKIYYKIRFFKYLRELAEKYKDLSVDEKKRIIFDKLSYMRALKDNGEVVFNLGKWYEGYDKFFILFAKEIEEIFGFKVDYYENVRRRKIRLGREERAVITKEKEDDLVERWNNYVKGWKKWEEKKMEGVSDILRALAVDMGLNPIEIAGILQKPVHVITRLMNNFGIKAAPYSEEGNARINRDLAGVFVIVDEGQRVKILEWLERNRWNLKKFKKYTKEELGIVGYSLGILIRETGIEREFIEKLKLLYKKYNGEKIDTAKSLGIHKDSFYRLLDELEIEWSSEWLNNKLEYYARLREIERIINEKQDIFDRGIEEGGSADEVKSVFMRYRMIKYFDNMYEQPDYKNFEAFMRKNSEKAVQLILQNLSASGYSSPVLSLIVNAFPEVKMTKYYFDKDMWIKLGSKDLPQSERKELNLRLWKIVSVRGADELDWEDVANLLGITSKDVIKAVFSNFAGQYSGDYRKISEETGISADEVEKYMKTAGVEAIQKVEYLKEKAERGEELTSRERQSLMKKLIDGGNIANSDFMPRAFYFYVIAEQDEEGGARVDIYSNLKIKVKADAGVKVKVTVFWDKDYGWMFNVNDKKSYRVKTERGETKFIQIDPAMQTILDYVRGVKNIFRQRVEPRENEIEDLTEDYGRSIVIEAAKGRMGGDKDMPFYPFIIYSETEGNVLRFNKKLKIFSEKIFPHALYRIEPVYNFKQGRWLFFVHDIDEKIVAGFSLSGTREQLEQFTEAELSNLAENLDLIKTWHEISRLDRQILVSRNFMEKQKFQDEKAGLVKRFIDYLKAPERVKLLKWQETAEVIGIDAEELKRKVITELIRAVKGDLTGLSEILGLAETTLKVGYISAFGLTKLVYLVNALAKVRDGKDLEDEAERLAIFRELFESDDGRYFKDPSFPVFSIVGKTGFRAAGRGDDSGSYVVHLYTIYKDKGKIHQRMTLAQGIVEKYGRKETDVRVTTSWDPDYGWLFNLYEVDPEIKKNLRETPDLIYRVIPEQYSLVLINPDQQRALDAISGAKNIFNRPIKPVALKKEYMDGWDGARQIVEMVRHNKFDDAEITIYPFYMTAVKAMEKGQFDFGKILDERYAGGRRVISFANINLTPGKKYKLEQYFSKTFGSRMFFAYEVLQDDKLAEKPALAFSGKEEKGDTSLYKLEDEQLEKCLAERGEERRNVGGWFLPPILPSGSLGMLGFVGALTLQNNPQIAYAKDMYGYFTALIGNLISRVKEGFARKGEETEAAGEAESDKTVIPSVEELIKENRIDFENAVEVRVNTFTKRHIRLDETYKSYPILFMAILLGINMLFGNAQAILASLILYMAAIMGGILYINLSSILTNKQLEKEVKIMDIFSFEKYFRLDSFRDFANILIGKFHRTKESKDIGYMTLQRYSDILTSNDIIIFMPCVVITPIIYIVNIPIIVNIIFFIFVNLLLGKYSSLKEYLWFFKNMPNPADRIDIIGTDTFADTLKKALLLFKNSLVSGGALARSIKGYLADLLLDNDENGDGVILIAKIKNLPLPVRYFIRPKQMTPEIKRALKERNIRHSYGISVIGLDSDLADAVIQNAGKEHEKGYLWQFVENVIIRGLCSQTSLSEVHKTKLNSLKKLMQRFLRLQKDLYQDAQAVARANDADQKPEGEGAEIVITQEMIDSLYSLLCSELPEDSVPDKELLRKLIGNKISARDSAEFKALLLESVENAEIIGKVGLAIEHVFKDTISKEKKEEIIVSISFGIMRNKRAIDKELEEEIRYGLDRIGYGVKSDEIIDILIRIKKDVNRQNEFTAKSDYYFIRELEKLLGYEANGLLEKLGIDIRPHQSGFTGAGVNVDSNEWQEQFSANDAQWALSGLMTDKQSKGVIVQSIKDLGPGVLNWLEGMKRDNINIENVKMVYVTSGLSDEEKLELKRANLQNIILVETLEEVINDNQGANIVYLADNAEIIENKDKHPNVKYILNGQAGPLVELTLALFILDASGIGEISQRYEAFLSRIVRDFVKDGLVNKTDIDVEKLLEEFRKFGYIRLPKIDKLLNYWKKLTPEKAYLETSA